MAQPRDKPCPTSIVIRMTISEISIHLKFITAEPEKVKSRIWIEAIRNFKKKIGEIAKIAITAVIAKIESQNQSIA